MKLIPRDFDLFSTPFEGFGSLMSIKHPMSTDIVEDGENLKIIMDLPGEKKDNVKNNAGIFILPAINFWKLKSRLKLKTKLYLKLKFNIKAKTNLK